MTDSDIIPVERAERSILLLRGQKVIIDETLAALYGVTTSRLNEQVKRSLQRFPQDFVFQLSEQEYASSRSQNAILKKGRGRHRKYLPYAFSEHGALMAASVLNSPRAIEMSILIVRAFVKLRLILNTHRRLAAKIGELERKLSAHDQQFVAVFDAIRHLAAPPAKTKARIGFVV